MLHENPELIALKGRLHRQFKGIQGEITLHKKSVGYSVLLENGRYYPLHPSHQQRWMLGEVVMAQWDSDKRTLLPYERIGGSEKAYARLVWNEEGWWGRLLEAPWVSWLLQNPEVLSEPNRNDCIEVAWHSSLEQRCAQQQLQFSALQTLVSSRDPHYFVKVELLKQGYLASTPKFSAPPISEGGAELDLTHLPLITLDDVQTLDIDDAIGVEPAEEGYYQLHIAISDAGVQVPEGSELDKLAYQRSGSLYFPGFSLPMLPPELAYQSASLWPGHRRAALVLSWKVSTENHEIESQTQIRWGVIQSSGRWEYRSVSDWLLKRNVEAPEVLSGGRMRFAQLENLWQCASRLAVKRQSLGGLFPSAQNELKWHWDEKGFPIGAEWRPKCLAQRMVEALMVHANSSLAQYACDNPQYPFLFMRYPGFQAQHLERVQSKLQQWGWRFSLEELKSQRGFREALLSARSMGFEKEALPHPFHPWMARAQLSYQPGPHRHLGVEAYGTWTSPIRKYSDLWNIRTLKQCFHRAPPPLRSVDLEPLRLKRHAGKQIENYIHKKFYLHYLDNQWRGQKALLGRVVGLSFKGVFVELPKLGATGWLPCKDWLPHRSGWKYEEESQTYRDGAGQARLGLHSFLRVGWKRLNSQGTGVVLSDLGDLG